MLILLSQKIKKMIQETKYLSWTEIGLYEYLLVAHPDSIVSSKIMAERESFSLDYHHKMAAATRPHITIANFLANEAMEDTIIRYTQRICCQQQSFEVSLNNYSGFPPHSVYLRVQNPQPFKQLAKELKVISGYVNSCSCPPVKLTTNPHLTIAGRLPETIYLKAMMDYSQKTFHETFVVDALVLLRRSSEFDDCKVIQVFGLQPQDGK